MQTLTHHMEHVVVQAPIDVDEREILHVLDELAYDDDSPIGEIRGGDSFAANYSDLATYVINAARA